MAGFVDSLIVPHRTWHCKAIHWGRVQGISDDLVQEARGALVAAPNHPCWCQGLMPKSWMPTIPVSQASHTIWYKGSNTGTFEGTTVYTDAPLWQFHWWKEASRAGWGIAQVFENGDIEHGCYGPLPGPIQTVPMAELHAICEALGPIRIHTVHKPIVDGLLRSKEWAGGPARGNADL